MSGREYYTLRPLTLIFVRAQQVTLINKMKTRQIPVSIVTAAVVLLFTHMALAASVSRSNTGDVNIPDAGGYVSSTIAIASAPAGATVTGIDVSFRCAHTYSGDLVVD